MAVKAGGSIGTELCRILGLDPGEVKSISIHFNPQDVVMVEVVQFVELEETAMFFSELRHYQLTPKPDPVAIDDEFQGN